MATNEEIIRTLYKVAEVKDAPAFVAMFAEGGYFYDGSAGQLGVFENLGASFSK